MKYICFSLIMCFMCYANGQNTSFEQQKGEYLKYLSTKDYDKALKKAKQINQWSLKNYSDSSLIYAISFRLIGNVFWDLKDLDSAESYYFWSYSVLKNQKRGKSKDAANALNNIANIYYAKGNYIKAKEYHIKTLDIRKSLVYEENLDCAMSHNNIGEVYSKMGELTKSEFHFLQAYKIYDNKNLYDATYLKILYNISNLYLIYKQPKKSLFYLNKIHFFFLNNKETRSISYANYLISLGQAYTLTENKDTAVLYFRIANNLIESINEFNSIEYFKLNLYLGKLLCFHMNDLINGPKYLNKAVVLANNNNKININLKAGAFLAFGQSQNLKFHLNEAIIYLQSILHEYEYTTEKDIDYDLYYTIITNLGFLYLKKGNYDSATLCFANTTRYYKDNYGIEHPYYLKNQQAIGILYEELFLYEKAYYTYKEIIETIKKQNTTIDNELYTNTLIRISNVASYLKKYNEAIKYLDNADNSLVNNDVDKRMEILNLIGFTYYQKKEYDITLNYLSRAYYFFSKEINTMTAMLTNKELLQYWDNKKLFFDYTYRLTSKFLNNNSSILALNASIFSKSLLLHASIELENVILKTNNTTFTNQYNEMKYYRQLYSKLQSEGSDKFERINHYKNQADSLDKILVNEVGEYAAAKRKFEITWKDVQDSLQYNHAAIEFARYYDDKDTVYKYMALVVRPGYTYPKLVPLASETAIKKAVKSKNFPALYNLVWKDIDTLLNGVTTIYYSPAGELNNIAFSALCYNNGQSSSTCNTYLLDKYSLHQLTTTRYLADGTLKKSKPLKTEIALFGGINFDVIPESANYKDTNQSNESYVFQINLEKEKQISGTRNATYSMGMPYLKGTMIEVGNIGALMNANKWKVETKTYTAASEHNLKKLLQEQNPGVLHIATHGFAFAEQVKKEKRIMMLSNEYSYRVSEDPMVRCGLMLGGSNISWTGHIQKMVHETGEDGILTAAEVANMDLRGTKLAVLSACETGLGQIESTEGTFGLKRGFKLAGVEQIIVSLWSVPDKETMEMMNLFYSDLAITGDPVISFEKSQKSMRDKYPTQPTKWAGFVLVR